MKNLYVESHSEKFRGRNFKHFKIPVEHSRNAIAGHCITSSHKDIKRYLKDRGIGLMPITTGKIACSVKEVLAKNQMKRQTNLVNQVTRLKTSTNAVFSCMFVYRFPSHVASGKMVSQII